MAVLIGCYTYIIYCDIGVKLYHLPIHGCIFLLILQFFFGATCFVGSSSLMILMHSPSRAAVPKPRRLPVVCFARVTKEILSWRLIICRPLFSCKALDQVPFMWKILVSFGMDKKNNFTTSELNDFSSVAWVYRLYSPLPPPCPTLPISLEPPLWARLPDTRSAPLTSAQATAPSISSVDHETNHIFRHLEYGNLVNPKWIPPGNGTILPGFMGASRRLLYTTLKVSILEPVAAQEKLSVFAEISGNLHDFR